MRGKWGFKLLELLIVVIILGAFMVLVIPKAADATNVVRIMTCKNNVRLINTQIELYHHEKGFWPNNLADVTEDVERFPDGPPQCPFGHQYVMHKQNNRYRVVEHTHR
jgi:competence protein ComGC